MPLSTNEATNEAANDLVNTLKGAFKTPPGFRPAHAPRILLSGAFTPTPTAASLSVARHFNQASTPITARFSNNTGIPTIPDNDSNTNPCGFAIRLNISLDEHNRRSHTDIVTHSTAFLPNRTGQDFLDLLTATISGNHGPYLTEHSAAAAFVQDPEPTPAFRDGKAKDKDPVFLHNEIQTRLMDAGAISFKLLAQIGEQGDVTDGATVQ
ncbi:hypothetical protein DV736_g1278, partial [Chaetothyriales sp. CBS 134916]